LEMFKNGFESGNAKLQLFQRAIIKIGQSYVQRNALCRKIA